MDRTRAIEFGANAEAQTGVPYLAGTTRRPTGTRCKSSLFREGDRGIVRTKVWGSSRPPNDHAKNRLSAAEAKNLTASFLGTLNGLQAFRRACRIVTTPLQSGEANYKSLGTESMADRIRRFPFAAVLICRFAAPAFPAATMHMPLADRSEVALDIVSLKAG